MKIFLQIGKGDAGDVFQRFLREKGLVGGENHIGTGYQDGEDIILDHDIGEILIK